MVHSSGVETCLQDNHYNCTTQIRLYGVMGSQINSSFQFSTNHVVDTVNMVKEELPLDKMKFELLGQLQNAICFGKVTLHIILATLSQQGSNVAAASCHRQPYPLDGNDG